MSKFSITAVGFLVAFAMLYSPPTRAEKIWGSAEHGATATLLGFAYFVLGIGGSGNMAKDRLLYIEWDDHCSSNNRWQSRKRFKAEGAPCRSIGWVIAESKDAITLAATSDFYPDDNDPHFKADQTILKACITKKRLIKVP